MTKQEFIQIRNKIRAYYPDSSILETNECIIAWYEVFKNMTYATLDKAVDIWVMDNKWPPSIAELLECSKKANAKLQLMEIENIYLKGGAR